MVGRGQKREFSLPNRTARSAPRLAVETLRHVSETTRACCQFVTNSPTRRPPVTVRTERHGNLPSRRTGNHGTHGRNGTAGGGQKSEVSGQKTDPPATTRQTTKHQTPLSNFDIRISSAVTRPSHQWRRAAAPGTMNPSIHFFSATDRHSPPGRRTQVPAEGPVRMR